jgi:hypothetical protein
MRFEFVVGQAIKEVREGEHELLDAASVDDGRLFLSLFAWRERVSKTVTTDWLVQPMRVVCLVSRLLHMLCMRPVSRFNRVFFGNPRSTSSLWIVLTTAWMMCIATP